MAIKNTLVKINTNHGKSLNRFKGNLGQTYKVNNRSITVHGGKFQDNKNINQKLEMRGLQAKLSSGDYDNNEIAKRKIERKIATQASELYGMDKNKLTKQWQGKQGSMGAGVRTNVDTSKGAQILLDKVNQPLSSKK